MKVSVILLMLLPFFCVGQDDFYEGVKYTKMEGVSSDNLTQVINWRYCLDTRVRVNDLEVWFESMDLGLNFVCQKDYYASRKVFQCQSPNGVWEFSFSDRLMTLHREGDSEVYIFKVE
jgi:hypothetical protein